MGPSVRLSLAGFLATAVAFGPARMGYGLFLPAFREDFALSTERAGFIASAAFAAFLAGLPVSAFGLHWRLTWTLFAAAGLAAALVNMAALPAAAAVATAGDRLRDWGWRLRSLAHAEALPLAAVALSFGVTNRSTCPSPRRSPRGAGGRGQGSG